MKKLLSVLLATMMLLTMIPLGAVPVLAEESAPAQAEPMSEEEEYIYYSDLFYGYSSYLMHAPVLLEHRTDTQYILNKVYEEYRDSPSFAFSNIKDALGAAFDLKAWTQKVTDAFGYTSFTYEKALDAANVDLATHMLGGSAVANYYGAEAKWIKKFNDILKVYDTFDKNYEVSMMTDTQVFTAMLAVLDDSSVLVYISSAQIQTLSEDILPHISTITKILSKGGDILTAAKTIATGIMLEDFRLEMIDAILKNTTSGTMLYDGMSRLKSQMQKGFVTYFLENYVKEAVLGELSGNVVKKLTETVLGDMAGVYQIIGAVTKVASWIVFDCIFKVPDIDDLTKQMVLSEYAYNLFDALETQAGKFSAQFTTQDVTNFETIASAYVAATNAALAASDAVKLSSNQVRLAEITEKYSADGFYDSWMEDVKTLIQLKPYDQRTITDFGTWNITENTTLSNGSDTIEKNTIYFPAEGLKANVYKSHDYYRKNMAVLEGHSLKLIGNMETYYNTSKFTIPSGSSLEITGDFDYICASYSGSSGTKSNLNNNGTLLVSGDFTISGSYSYYFGGAQRAHVTNNGTITVGGKVTMDEAAGTFTNNGEVQIDGDLGVYNLGTIQNNSAIYCHNLTLYSGYKDPKPNQDSKLLMGENGVVYVYGNVEDRGSETITGTLDFVGTDVQEIYGLEATNIQVHNPNGIKYLSALYLYGCYTLNGNPLDNNGYKTYCYTGASFGDDSDYKNLCVPGKFYLKTSIKGNLTTTTDSNLIISKGAEVTITGNVSIGARANFTNNGKCTIDGKLYISGDGTSDSFKNSGELTLLQDAELGAVRWISIFSNTGTIKAHKNLTIFLSDNTIDGIVILAGTEAQTVKPDADYLNTLIIENTSTEGVTFKCGIKVNRLFDHRGNNFTLYNNGSGSTFVDYDGDGLKDNVDPEPTVGNPCTVYFQSEDVEKGTVSVESVETVGGTKVSAEAVPTAKYEFVQWVNTSGKAVSTSAVLEVVAKQDITYTAVFRKRSQPITVQVENGTITAPAKAEIESTVSVTVTGNEGYVYQEGSLSYNGIPMVDNTFVMPDEPVVLTATFVRNEHYFALKEVLEVAKTYDSALYTAETYAVLGEAMADAVWVMFSNISEAESRKHIALLQQAISGLKYKRITGGQNSISEDVSGLAFKFDVVAAGGQVVNNTEYVGGSASVVPGVDGRAYTLVRVGAVVSNQSDATLDLDHLDGGLVINVEGKYLCALDENTLSFAVRIINIPEKGMDTQIYARPYYVYECDGEEVVVYGDVDATTYQTELDKVTA